MLKIIQKTKILTSVTYFTEFKYFLNSLFKHLKLFSFKNFKSRFYVKMV